jgi:hypothetical protein
MVARKDPAQFALHRLHCRFEVVPEPQPATTLGPGDGLE